MTDYAYQSMVESCPSCRVDLTQHDAIDVDGTPCHVEDGNIMESTTTDTYLILSRPHWDLTANCKACGYDLGEFLGDEPQDDTEG